MGDVGQNSNQHAGHAGRHADLLRALHDTAKSVWSGQTVRKEPPDHSPYSSTYRPDLAFHALATGGGLMVGDLKLVDPLSSDPTKEQGWAAWCPRRLC